MSKDLIKADGPNVGLEAGVSALKAIIGNIPYVGSLLNEVLFDYRSRIKQERVNTYFREVAEETRQIAADKLDLTYLQTEEFSDLVEDIIHKVAVNASGTKRAYFRNLLRQALQGHRPPDMSRVLISILSEITDQEMLLFSKFYELSKQDENQKNPLSLKLDPERVESLGFDYKVFLLLIQSMIRMGLLYDDGPGKWGVRPHELIRITELGTKFYEYVTYK